MFSNHSIGGRKLPKTISVLVKPASGRCNASCKYCFYKDEASLREQSDFGLMSLETAENLIAKALDFSSGGRIFFTFQGGEPTLAGLDFFKRFVAAVNEKNLAHTAVFYGLQTNGSLLTKAWAKFFKDNDFLIGLSLDGDKKADRLRTFSGGTPLFDSTVKAINLLTEYGVQFNVLSVLTKYSANNVENVYAFFKRHNLKYLQFVPCLRPLSEKPTEDFYPTPKEYGNFLTKLFSLYVKDYLSGDFVSERKLDNFVRNYLGLPAELCGMNGHCNAGFVVEANGNVYPCDFYATDEYLLGNVNRQSFFEIAKNPKMIEFLQSSLKPREKCLSCKYFRVCRGGGCRRERQSEDFCEAYKIFFENSLPSFSVFENEN